MPFLPSNHDHDHDHHPRHHPSPRSPPLVSSAVGATAVGGLPGEDGAAATRASRRGAGGACCIPYQRIALLTLRLRSAHAFASRSPMHAVREHARGAPSYLCPVHSPSLTIRSVFSRRALAAPPPIRSPPRFFTLRHNPCWPSALLVRTARACCHGIVRHMRVPSSHRGYASARSPGVATSRIGGDLSCLGPRKRGLRPAGRAAEPWLAGGRLLASRI